MSVSYIKPYFADKKLKAGFFQKHGGVSQGMFSSLNCAVKSLDSPDNIEANRTIVCKELGFKEVFGLIQIHSNIVIVQEELDISKRYTVDADAIITKSKNMLLEVHTADCCPILLYEPDAQVIGAVHAGWGGLTSGVVKNAMEGFISLGADITKIMASIGPCIQPESYEVGEDFRDKILNNNKNMKQFFIEYDKKIYFNLSFCALFSLIESGLKLHNIQNISIDTYKEENGFFSYRRTYHQLKDKHADISKLYGTQPSVIGMLDI